ncbi:hypothetical protein AVEN_218805-1 [Araneus ventricosus]|uniref:Uncharacterized protein n=1 Tax=Araneus ventricosus TaxID=182803 RepID=A0A4Y2B4J0_ARAVE|nr:hypothetical protein AVEN_218805-1 [Araneus ventricosus]
MGMRSFRVSKQVFTSLIGTIIGGVALLVPSYLCLRVVACAARNGGRNTEHKFATRGCPVNPDATAGRSGADEQQFSLLLISTLLKRFLQEIRILISPNRILSILRE